MSFKVTQQCKENNQFGPFTISTKLGAGTYGAVYKVCNKSTCFALKESQGAHTVSRTNDASEILFLYFCQRLNDAGVTENLQYSYSFYTCVSCNSFLSLNPIETGDLWKFFAKSKTTLEWKNMYFQVLYGLYVFQKYTDGVHFDLHPGNVLYSCQKNTGNLGYTEYKVRTKKFYVENTGFTFKIADFGLSYSKSLSICNNTNLRPWKFYLSIDHEKLEMSIPLKIVDMVTIFRYYNYCNWKFKHPKNKEMEEWLNYWEYLCETQGVVLTFDYLVELFPDFLEKKGPVVKSFDSTIELP